MAETPPLEVSSKVFLMCDRNPFLVEMVMKDVFEQLSRIAKENLTAFTIIQHLENHK